VTIRSRTNACRTLGACALSVSALLAGRDARAQATPPAAGPRATAARVALEGVAWDSLSGVPLSGAVVQMVSASDLAGTSRTTTSDSLGRWRIDSLLPTTYVLGYFHPTLDALGLQPPSFKVLVQGDSVARLDFAIPGPTRMRTLLCGARQGSDSSGGIVGVLRDAESEMPVSKASISVSWRELVIDKGGVRTLTRRVPVVAREDGIFTACGVPTDTPVEVDASAPGLTSGIVELQVPLGGVVRRDLVLGDSTVITGLQRGLAAADSARQPDSAAVRRVPGGAELRGTVRTADGKPLPRAQVSVAGTGRAATTSESGTFTILELPPGTFGLDVRAVGYAPVRVAVDLLRRRPATVSVTMRDRVQALSSVVVRGKRTRSSRFLEEFAERKRRAAGGTFYGPAELERRNALYVTDILRTTAGMRVTPSRGFGNLVRGRGNCSPAVFLDGMPLYEGANELDQIVRPNDLMAMEVYQALGNLPAQYAGLQSNGCGAIALWTKR
jgi:hypothetical protein